MKLIQYQKILTTRIYFATSCTLLGIRLKMNFNFNRSSDTFVFILCCIKLSDEVSFPVYKYSTTHYLRFSVNNLTRG